jgi:tRNA pseudouridine38-40 synthase
MARYQVIIAYDGTRYMGYQRQQASPVSQPVMVEKGGVRTVQGEVEAALRQMGWDGRSILSAGRTDTGVHAAGQVIAFDLEWHHTLQELCQALNAHLPADIAAQHVVQVRPDFHPRYDAVARRYRYTIFCQAERDPLRERFAWRVWPAVQLEVVHKTAQLFLGEHDFSAFGTPPKPASSTVRMVKQAGWYTSETGFCFEICANAFLYHMVRRLVFIQVMVGQGKLTDEDVRGSLAAGQIPIHGIAPAKGLALVEVEYPDRVYQIS